MKRLFAFAAAATLLLLTAPADAAVDTSAPGGAQGITREEMAKVLTEHGMPAKLGKDSNGVDIISSRATDVNFDMYFYECHDGRCRDIQFAAGWSNANVTPQQVNEWNTTKRFLRVYTKPGKIIWAEMDARIAYGTTANIEEYVVLWPEMLREFKEFFRF